ncbi:unnamed protein product [Alopecurus aequalis]
MKATTRRGGGAAGALPAVKTKKRKDGGGFMWGCGSSKSVSVAAGNLSSAATTPQPRPSSATATAKPVTAAKKTAALVPASQEGEGAASVDTLLRQLRELERGVRALGVRDRERGGDSCSAQTCRCSGRPPPQRHRRSASDVWGGGAACAGAGGRGRLEEESVAVVTETTDPLGDFRRSMAEMVVENGIRGGAEMRELLQRFLSLNSARHHHLILLAFADVWQELFAGSGDGQPRTSKQKHLPYGARATELASKHVHAAAL